jgi:[ribosomal protein S5]-alanine N-acetyltransferase
MTTLTTLPAVETPQLVIREIEPHDWEAFCDFMITPSYQRYITMRLRNEDEVKAFVNRTVARHGDDRRHVFHLAAEGLREGIALGDGFIIRQKNRISEIGWGVHPEHWGRGLGTEIGRALLGLAIERLHAPRVWAKVMSANGPSLQLARRIGLRHVETDPHYPAGGGRFEPVDIFSLTSNAYYDLPY